MSKSGSGLGGEKIVCKELKYLGFLEVCWALQGSLLCFAGSAAGLGGCRAAMGDGKVLVAEVQLSQLVRST